MKYVFAFLALMAIIVFGASILALGLGLVPKSVGIVCAACSAASVYASSGQIYD